MSSWQKKVTLCLEIREERLYLYKDHLHWFDTSKYFRVWLKCWMSGTMEF